MSLQRPPNCCFQLIGLLFFFSAAQIYQRHALRLSSCIQKKKRTSSKRQTPPKTRPVNLLDPTMKTTYFQAECTFKPPEQRFKRRAFHLARHLLLAFALKNSKILQSWVRIQRIAPVLINRCLRHFPMQCGFSANRRNTESKNVFAPAQTSTQKICKGTRSDNVINQ